MKHLFLAAGFILALGALPATAEERATDQARAITVSYADLNLQQSDDAANLLSRLRLASARACSAADLHRPSPAARRAIAACREQAMAQALAQLDEPELTRLNAERQR